MGRSPRFAPGQKSRAEGPIRRQTLDRAFRAAAGRDGLSALMIRGDADLGFPPGWYGTGPLALKILVSGRRHTTSNRLKWAPFGTSFQSPGLPTQEATLGLRGRTSYANGVVEGIGRGKALAAAFFHNLFKVEESMRPALGQPPSSATPGFVSEPLRDKDYRRLL
jgi:hypothetical protein